MTIDELKQIAAAATPGPWTMDQPWCGFSGFRGKDDAPVFFTAARLAECPRAREDHAVVLAALNHFAALLKTAEAAQILSQSAGEHPDCNRFVQAPAEDMDALHAALADLEAIR